MAAFTGQGLATAAQTVASGTFGNVAWRLSATDSASGYVCLTMRLPQRSWSRACGSIFGPTAGRAHGLTYLAHTGRPAPDYIVGPVVATAKTVIIVLSNGRTLTGKAIPPPKGMTAKIGFYAAALPSGARPSSVRGIDAGGRIVAHLDIPSLRPPSKKTH